MTIFIVPHAYAVSRECSAVELPAPLRGQGDSNPHLSLVSPRRLERRTAGLQPATLPNYAKGTRFFFLPRHVGVCAWQFGQRNLTFSMR